MRGIARAAPALARPIRPRQAVLPHAGPSTRPLCTSRIPRYPRATEPPLQTTVAEVAEPVIVLDEVPELDDAQVIALSAKQQLDEAFAQRAVRLHSAPLGPLDPILLPLSSLASPDPTGPDGSGMAIALPRDIFGERIRRDILHRCVIWFRSAMRQGTHKQQGRSEVSYSGRKLRPQKKTGRARLGDRSNPIMKGGARAFPKRPRNYTQLLPRKIRAMGMRVALSLKLESGLLRCVKSLNEGGWTKTKEAHRALAKRVVWTSEARAIAPGTAKEGEVSTNKSVPLSLTPRSQLTVGFDGSSTKTDLSILFVYPHTKPAAEVQAFARPLRNLPGVEIMSTDEVQVYHMLKYRWLVLEAGAVDILTLTKGQPQIDERESEWEDEELQVGDPKAADIVLAPSVKRPVRWLVHRWRKLRGRKSMRKVFGMRYASAVARESKMTWRKIEHLGIRPTPDMVAMAIAGKYVREDRTARRMVP